MPLKKECAGIPRFRKRNSRRKKAREKAAAFNPILEGGGRMKGREHLAANSRKKQTLDSETWREVKGFLREAVTHSPEGEVHRENKKFSSRKAKGKGPKS